MQKRFGELAPVIVAIVLMGLAGRLEAQALARKNSAVEHFKILLMIILLDLFGFN